MTLPTCALCDWPCGLAATGCYTCDGAPVCLSCMGAIGADLDRAFTAR